jgi:uncharacterized RDD family membrane protein YckC
LWKQELNRKIEGYRGRQKSGQEPEHTTAAAPDLPSSPGGTRLRATAGSAPQAGEGRGAIRETPPPKSRLAAPDAPKTKVSPGWRRVTPPPTTQPLLPLSKASGGSAKPPQPAQSLPAGNASPQAAQDGRQGREVSAAAPIAPITVRAVAGVLDFAVIVVALGVFLGVFYMIGGVALTDVEGLRSIAIAFLGIVCFYWVFYVGYLGGTSGMNWLGLRVLNFDGEPPSGPQRRTRALGTILSTLSLGLGFAWSIADEEKLTWHDRMSKTFVTRDGSVGFRARTPGSGVAGKRLPELRNATRA